MISEIIKKYLHQPLLIAYSGGLDSTVLLHEIVQLKKKIPQIKIRAIHINHNLNLLSYSWEQHCRKVCNKYQVELIVKKIKIDKFTKNIEEQLRIKRYNIIYNSLLINELVLTGHHMDDQSETLILSLKRGSGPNGLSAMSLETILGKTKIIRPLLSKNKKELELWAKYNDLSWIEDSSNFSTMHDRNFIRHKILPILEKRWPYFVKNCFRTANICNEETKLINILLKEKIKNFINSDNSLNIKKLKKIKKEICIGLIRYWMMLKNIKRTSYSVIQAIYKQMICSNQDANPRIILQKNEIRRYKKSLYFIQKQKNIKNKLLFWHENNAELTLPNNLGILIKNDQGISLPAPKKNELISIRFQYEGKILILGRNKRQKIKKIWQEKNIPAWLRDQIPLLFYDNNFISALGVFIVNVNDQNRTIWKISWVSNLKLNNNVFIFN